ncbi:hypothetical protein CHS0354_035333 [Potamilus streckersoni]|uniref:Aspartate/glutamate/uridylate kinase domain-containing protein n=1 Tax=Potamilus streckersoni TaxID=2493646 RepID=A0AAE0VPC7_9BIVA|nr:hypothetical protein CHS0354_035333 [Potamilus streckersoni]
MKSGMRPLIVVKIGTNVLTLPSGRVNINLILDIVDQIAVLAGPLPFLLVSSGAVGTGRGLVNLDYIKDARLRKQMHAAVGQGKIYSVYANALAEKGIVSAQALLTKRDFKIPEHFNSIMNTLKSLIEADKLIILSDIQGAFYVRSKTDKSASLVRTIDRISEETMKLCRNTLSGGGTGGMYSKLTAVKTGDGSRD